MATTAKTMRPPYQRPRVEIIPLATEEVVLAACKTVASGSMGGKNTGASSCTRPMACFTPGS
jgi:hypothetical protein